MEMQSNPMSPSASEKYDEKMAGEFGGPGAPASYYEYSYGRGRFASLSRRRHRSTWRKKLTPIRSIFMTPTPRVSDRRNRASWLAMLACLLARPAAIWLLTLSSCTFTCPTFPRGHRSCIGPSSGLSDPGHRDWDSLLQTRRNQLPDEHRERSEGV